MATPVEHFVQHPKAGDRSAQATADCGTTISPETGSPLAWQGRPLARLPANGVDTGQEETLLEYGGSIAQP